MSGTKFNLNLELHQDRMFCLKQGQLFNDEYTRRITNNPSRFFSNHVDKFIGFVLYGLYPGIVGFGELSDVIYHRRDTEISDKDKREERGEFYEFRFDGVTPGRELTLMRYRTKKKSGPLLLLSEDIKNKCIRTGSQEYYELGIFYNAEDLATFNCAVFELFDTSFADEDPNKPDYEEVVETFMGRALKAVELNI